MLALQRARNALRTDAARVSDALHELVASDDRFVKKSDATASAYDAKLQAASKRVEAIARRERQDNCIRWWSFTVFFAVVAFIWSQRLFGVTLF